MAFKGGVTCALVGLILLLTASILPEACHAKKAGQVGPSKTVVVGENEKWRFGFNYTDWAIKNSPFYVTDTLVFKYDAPNATTHPHSVSLLKDFKSFLSCDMTNSKLVANVTQGGGDGFKFVLDKSQPYYFVCGERAGFHCKVGMMKFEIFPLPADKFVGPTY